MAGPEDSSYFGKHYNTVIDWQTAEQVFTVLPAVRKPFKTLLEQVLTLESFVQVGRPLTIGQGPFVRVSPQMSKRVRYVMEDYFYPTLELTPLMVHAMIHCTHLLEQKDTEQDFFTVDLSGGDYA